MNWVEALIGILGALGALGGLSSLLTVRASKRRIMAKADETVAGAAKVLIGGAADLVEPLRRQLDVAETRAEQINGQLRKAERRIDQLDIQLERICGWIHDPYMTLDQLRARVPAPSGFNGTAANG